MIAAAAIRQGKILSGEEAAVAQKQGRRRLEKIKRRGRGRIGLVHREQGTLGFLANTEVTLRNHLRAMSREDLWPFRERM